jgi:histidine triad (HIT) family protein
MAVNPARPDCLFCRVIAGQAPAQVIYRDDQVTAIRDIHPQAPTHILLLPNRHIAGVSDAQAADEALLGALLRAGVRLAEQEGLAESGYRLVINTGANAGQSVFHLHVHLLGGRAMRWPPG